MKKGLCDAKPFRLLNYSTIKRLETLPASVLIRRTYIEGSSRETS